MRQISGFCFSCHKVLTRKTHTHKEKFTADRFEGGVTSLFPNTSIDYQLPLCDKCLHFPDQTKSKNIVVNSFAADVEQHVRQVMMEVLINNLANRYYGPKSVILGLIFTELTDVDGTILIGKRSPLMMQYPDTWALITGFMEVKNGGWRGDLRIESEEEVVALIDAGNEHLVQPYTFVSVRGGKLILNVALILPGATTLGDFVPNEETVERREFKFTRSNRPEFGIPIHNLIFDRFCKDRFGWDIRD